MDYVPISEFPSYGINDNGDVINLVTGRRLGHHIGSTGHAYVSLGLGDNVRYVRSVGRLVADAFLPRPYDPREDTIIHLDYRLSNNSVDNLAWRTRGFAVSYQRQAKSGYYPIIKHPIRIVETNQVLVNSDEVCTTFGALDISIAVALDDPNKVIYPLDMHIVSG